MFSNFWLEAVEAGEDTREVTMLLSTSPPPRPDALWSGQLAPDRS
jgi:hypothetical protein